VKNYLLAAEQPLLDERCVRLTFEYVKVKTKVQFSQTVAWNPSTKNIFGNFHLIATTNPMVHPAWDISWPRHSAVLMYRSETRRQQTFD
jgi:hypothetical protein